ncbi:hypothetical protein (belongs to CMGI-2) [Cupriavidus metallidurans CH34]|uniref:Uncharacterized protein n=2 Tax=Cupriavidus metallidurans TaxID=119219 RepID=Q1LNU2_CUPMC|nr:hypothetical protein (belongs to CMGI-2) [Cupriavidus metallidurans CH34]
MLNSVGRWNNRKLPMPASDSDLLAAAAHMHVLLRRKTGRVTDTEWMATNAEYARAMIEFAREKARSEQIEELLPLADRVEGLLASRTPPARPVWTGPRSQTPAPPAPASGPAEEGPLSSAQAALASRYIGRLR